jgi:hypothetical protein
MSDFNKLDDDISAFLSNLNSIIPPTDTPENSQEQPNDDVFIPEKIEGLEIYDPYKDTSDTFVPEKVEGLEIYDPYKDNFAEETTFSLDENLPVVPEKKQENYDDITFSLDDVVPVIVPKSSKKQPAAETDSRFDDIGDVVFEEITVKTDKKSSLDDIETVTLDEVKVDTQQTKSTLDDVAELEFAEPVVVKEEKKTLDDIDTPEPVLVDAAPKTEYKPTFNDADLEAAKKKAVVAAKNAALADTGPSKEKLESLREFQREKESEMAKKGGKLVFLCMFFGILASVAMYLFSSEIWIHFKSDAVFAPKIAPYLTYGCYGTAFLSVLLIVPSGGLKSLCNFLNFFMFLGAIGFAVPLGLGKENMLYTVITAAVAFGLYLTNFLMLAGNDNIEMFYKKKDVKDVR